MFPGRNNWTSRFLEKTASFGPWCRAPTMPLSPLSPRVKSRVRMRTSGSSSVDRGGRSNRNDAERFATDTSRTGNSRNLASNHAVIAILKMAKPMNLAGFVSKKWEFHQPKLGTVKKKRPYCWLMELLCLHSTLESSCRPENAIYIVWTLDAAQQPLRGAEMVLAVRNGGFSGYPENLAFQVNYHNSARLITCDSFAWSNISNCAATATCRTISGSEPQKIPRDFPIEASKV